MMVVVVLVVMGSVAATHLVAGTPRWAASLSQNLVAEGREVGVVLLLRGEKDSRGVGGVVHQGKCDYVAVPR
jgi:hypothetical protein